MTIWMNVTGWTLVHFVWQGALIALVTAGALRLLRGSAATTRYGVTSMQRLLGTVPPLEHLAAEAAGALATTFERSLEWQLPEA